MDRRSINLGGLVSALEARFPAIRKIVGEDFFKGAAKLFATTQPPRSPLMLFYGDAFPTFFADFEPAREVPYLADVARLEAARTRANHAADAKPLTPPRSPAAPRTPWRACGSFCTPRLKSSRRTIRS